MANDHAMVPGEIDKIPIERLDVQLDYMHGEVLQSMLPVVVDNLESKASRESQGACGILGRRRSRAVRKPTVRSPTSDRHHSLSRGSMEARAALRGRFPKVALYNLFEIARRWGYEQVGWSISFGSVLGSDGKPIKT